MAGYERFELLDALLRVSVGRFRRSTCRLACDLLTFSDLHYNINFIPLRNAISVPFFAAS